MNNVNKIFKLKKAGIRPYKKMHSKFVLQNLFERVNKIIRISEEYRFLNSVTTFIYKKIRD